MTKILFFTTAIEHTTFRKTAKMLNNEGASVKMLGFTRNNFPVSHDFEINVKSYGSISHGNYFSRMFKLLKILPSLLRNSKDADVIYNFTLDTLIVSKILLFFSNKTWVYQVQDIRSVYFGESLKNRLYRALEKLFINRVDFVVVSSLNFYTGFFKKHYNLDENKVQVIENKLIEDSLNKYANIKRVSDKITIGYFGVLRCPRSWNILTKLAIENASAFHIYVRGKFTFITDLENEVQRMNNISYGGEYRSPDELAELYTNVDLVWAAYPYSDELDGNWKYARTIRFYEACAFGKPVIVQKGTPQELDVLKYDIGLVVDMANVKETISLLSNITYSQLKIWENNIDSLPRSYYYHTDEYSKLLITLKQNTNE